MEKTRIWYHISLRDYGDRKLFYPRQMNDWTYNRSAICVAPSIVECLLSMPPWDKKQKKLFVYQAKTRAFNKYTKQIFDYRWTREHRIYRRTWFTKTNTIEQKFFLDWLREIKDVKDILACHSYAKVYPLMKEQIEDIYQSILRG